MTSDDLWTARWVGWAKRLQSMAQAGLTYSRDRYDLARYQEIAEIAVAMMAESGGIPPERVRDIFGHETGHPTPKVDVRAAVFRPGTRGLEILLVRERADGRWSLPGGWADVGESPSESAAREVLEESGYRVRVTRLLAVWDKGKHPHPPQPFYVYKLIFEAEVVASEGTGGDGFETDGVGFFRRAEVPPLSLDRVLPEQLDRLFEMHEQGKGGPALFD